MPTKAGIHLRFRWQAKENLDSGLRRNDERKSRLLVDEFRTPRLGAEVHSVIFKQSERWIHARLLRITRRPINRTALIDESKRCRQFCHDKRLYMSLAYLSLTYPLVFF